ncbi:MAG: N-acetylglutamate synthase, CG3035 family [Mycobacterium sp.]
MPNLPAVGTRVSLRYRLPTGSVPPLTDVIGHLMQTDPRVRVQTKTGAVVEIAPGDVVAVRALTAVPVRTSQIRATEHAAAMAWSGIEQRWLDGWLLRSANGHTHRANSAVPLGVEADAGALPAIIDWYAHRGQTPWLAVPDRLLRLAKDVPVQLETVVMVRELPDGEPDTTVKLAPRPDEQWLRMYERKIPVDVLTAVIDGVVVFATRGAAGVGRAAVTVTPDGTRWVGLSAVRVAEDQRRHGHARALCSALLAWGAQQGATRTYVQVLADNAVAIELHESMGFTTQHRTRYIDARNL